MPGYGGSSGPDAFAWESASESIAAYANAHCSRPWLVGMSGGAYRALQVATLGTDVRGVCAMAGFAHLPASMREGLSQAADALEAGADLTAALVGAWFSETFSNAHPGACSEVVRRCLTAAAPPVAAADVRAIASGPDLREELAAVRAPIHFLTGELDASTPLDLARAGKESAPNATLTVVKGAGHLIHHEAFEVVCEWLSRSLETAS